MSAVIVAGNTSGSVSLSAPDVAGSTVITLPSTSGTMALSGGAGSFTTLDASGVATFSAGSASAPAITTSGDTNTGVFFPAADTIAFAEGGTESMRIDSSGNLLAGATSFPGSSKINVAAVGGQQGIATYNTTAGYAAIYGQHSSNSGTGYVAYFTNTGSSTGLYISNTAAWQSTSDARLKTDVKDLNSTNRLLQLRAVDYLWKSQETSDEPTKRNFGFIAQEVKEIFPELVGVSPDGMFSVEYTGLIAPLVKAIQEQQALIENLTTRLSALENK